MDIKKEKIGLQNKYRVYILNVKIDNLEFRNALIGNNVYKEN